jgi:hypothetical protein
MSNSNPQSFVVLSDGMGKWRKGDVLAGSVLREAGADITRLLALKAIREATIHEAGSAHVEILSDGDRHLYFTTSPSRHSTTLVAIVPASILDGCCATTPS